MNLQFWLKEREWLKPYSDWINYKMPKLIWDIFVRISALTALMFFIAQENSRLDKADNPVIQTYIDFLEFVFFVGLLATMLQIILPFMAKTYDRDKLKFPSGIATICSFTVASLLTYWIFKIALPLVFEVYSTIVFAA